MRKGQLGGITVVEDNVNSLATQVLRWDVARSHQRVVDMSVMVRSGILVANPERPKECWCPCQEVRACSALRFKHCAKPVCGGGVLEGCCKGCWKGFQHWNGLLEGCQEGAESGFGAGTVRSRGLVGGGSSAGRGVPAGFHLGFQRRKGLQRGLEQGY